jgi:hypothetical protein
VKLDSGAVNARELPNYGGPLLEEESGGRVRDS